MTHGFSWGTTVAAAVLMAGAAWGQRPLDCGNEGQRTCKITDWEYQNNTFWLAGPCEPDLKSQDGRCVNNKRRLLTTLGGWTAWAMGQQTYRIGLNSPVNQITWMSAHNAYSNHFQGFMNPIYANQLFSITDQLNFGVRHLELDPHYYGIPGSQAVRLCHASDTALCAIPTYASRLMENALIEIRTWLNANPNEILIIKLDNHVPSGAMGEMINVIQRQLGDKTLAPPASFQRWPTIAEFRYFRKQVMFILHGDTVPPPNGVLWTGKGYFLDENWPVKQNFNTCEGSDYKTPGTRGVNQWWDTAEGRSGSNLIDQTGWFYEPDVAAAARCGVAIVGLDFLGAISRPTPAVIARDGGADLRIPAGIWSWKVGDFGVAGPAALERSTSRWVSRDESQMKPFACAVKKPQPNQDQKRLWQITPEAFRWDTTLAKQKCEQYFGSQYEFAYPTNGWQNWELRGVMSPTLPEVWLNYSAAPLVNLSVEKVNYDFLRTHNGPVPEGQIVRITAERFARLEIVEREQNADWLQFEPWPEEFWAHPGGTLARNALLKESAANLPPGVYTVNFKVKGTRTGAATEIVPMTFRYIHQAATSITLSSAQTSYPLGQGVPMTIKVQTTAPLPDGTKVAVKQRIGQEWFYAEQAVVDPKGNGTVSLLKLPLGTQEVVAELEDSDQFQGSVSNVVSVNIVPRHTVTPNPVAFQMTAGAAAPSAVTATVTGIQGTVYYEDNCPWLATVAVPGGVSLRPEAVVTGYAAGFYACQLTVRDHGIGRTEVPVSLRVLGALQASPNAVELKTLKLAVTTAVQVTGDASAVPTLRASANAAWLQVELSAGTTLPKTLQLTANPANLPAGLHTARVTISSDTSVSAFVDVKLTVVQPTTVTSTPVGRTVYVDGVPTVTPATFDWEPGTQHILGAAAIHGPSDVVYRFVKWNLGTALQYTVTAGQVFAYRAEFRTEYRLSRYTVPVEGGTVTVSPAPTPQSTYPAGTVVTVTAVPNSGFQFAGWSGAVTGTQTTQTVTMNQHVNVTAAFTRIVPVAVRFESAATGTQVSIDGVVYAMPVTVNWEPGKTYSVTALVPAPQATRRWIFGSWSNGGAQSQSIQAPQTATTYRVNYVRQYLLTTVASPATGGSVSGSGWYNAGAVATIRATPAAGQSFLGFSGAVTSTANPVTRVMNTAGTVTALFGPVGAPVPPATGGGSTADETN